MSLLSSGFGSLNVARRTCGRQLLRRDRGSPFATSAPGLGLTLRHICAGTGAHRVVGVDFLDDVTLRARLVYELEVCLESVHKAVHVLGRRIQRRRYLPQHSSSADI